MPWTPWDRRNLQAYDVSFYMTVAGVFACLMVAGLLAIVMNGVTEMRLLTVLVGGWYLVYMMDLIERRFRRDTDKVFWRRWFSFYGTPMPPEDAAGGDDQPSDHAAAH